MLLAQPWEVVDHCQDHVVSMAGICPKATAHEHTSLGTLTARGHRWCQWHCDAAGQQQYHTQPAGPAIPGSWVREEVANPVSMEKTWCWRVSHSELTAAFPGMLLSKRRKPAWRRFSLRCFSRSSSARDTVGNGEMPQPMCCQRSVSCVFQSPAEMTRSISGKSQWPTCLLRKLIRAGYLRGV